MANKKGIHSVECCRVTCHKGGEDMLKLSPLQNIINFLLKITAMVPDVLSILVCVLYIFLLPIVSADYCTAYTDRHGNLYEVQQCDVYCCGNCKSKHCCGDAKIRLSLEEQGQCPISLARGSVHRVGVILGSIVGSLLPVICLALVLCCVCPCCLLYKKCCKRRHTAAINTPNHTTVIYTPQQPPPPYPGYQPVPFQPHGHGVPPMPSAPPPPHVDFAAPGAPYGPAALGPGQPVPAFQPPRRPDDHAHPPYNPSYIGAPVPQY